MTLCKRLTSSLIYSRTDYACAVWHKTTSSHTSTAALQRVDNIAHRFTLGVFKTHPTEFLLHDSNSLRAKDRLDNKTNAAIARLLSLPPSNPAGALTLQALSHRRNRHLSTIHHAFQAPSSMWATLPTAVETLNPHSAHSLPPDQLTSYIADSKESSHSFIEENLASAPPDTFVVFCDGASQDSGTGAAAMSCDNRSLKLRLGERNHYTEYDGELLSFLLALGLARDAPSSTRFIWIQNDCQTAIRDITDAPSPKSGQNIRTLINREIRRLLAHCPELSIALLWCTKGGTAESHAEVDVLAKAAAHLHTTSHLPVSYAALQRLIKTQETTKMRAPEEGTPACRRLLNSSRPLEALKAKRDHGSATQIGTLPAELLPLPL